LYDFRRKKQTDEEVSVAAAIPDLPVLSARKALTIFHNQRLP
jgi:hypothetical protein